MSTAIISFCTTDGFVIAADGRRRKEGNGKVVSNTVQKIFSIEDGQKNIAYALAGATRYDAEDGQIPFDFSEESRDAIRTLSSRDFLEPEHYLRKLAYEVNKSLLSAMSTGRMKGYPTVPSIDPSIPEGTSILLFFAGYYKGNQFQSLIRFYHENQVPRWKISPLLLIPGEATILGPNIIRHLLWETNDPRFKKYRRRKPSSPEELTIEEAIKVANNYILAYSDPQAVSIDERCKDVGGHIHIATVTKGEGFRWIIEPLSNPVETKSDQ
jgi:hypothetical protein